MMKVKEAILAEEGYTSEKSMLNDVYLMNALAKIEYYRAECENFENKYGMKLKTFEHRLHKDKGKEDFLKEDDLQDWEFANAALKWWQEKLKDLRIVKDV